MINERIRELRELKGFKQEDIASMIKVTTQTYYKWESGKTEPKASQIKMLASALGVSINAIFSNEEIATNDETRLKIQETEKLDDEEKKCLNMFIEALILRHYSKNIKI